MYSIILTDIDGTLLHDDLTIGKDTISALARATEKGLLTALCSGRYMKSLDAIERMTGLKMMKIAFNGALIEHNGKLIRDVRLSREAFIKAIEFLKGKASALIAFTPDSYAIMADDFWLEEQDRILGEPGIAMDLSDYDEVARAAGSVPCKLLAKDNDTAKIRKLRDELTGILGPDAEVFSSYPNNIEIIPKNIDKGTALEAVSELLSIPLSEMIAFGDWDNDIGMLRTAGMGVCMANGSEGAKRAANMITASNNDDGIDKALRKLGI